MKSFVVKLKDFFVMNRGEGYGDENFLAPKRHLLIPLYQREYKWTEAKIECLVRDIAMHEKFLGIVILDEANDSYEIVDGQQRITTCILILAAIFNIYQGQPREQQNVLSLLQPYNSKFILKNDSVGDFIKLENGQIVIDITEQNDIYFQRDTFRIAYNLITQLLVPIQSGNTLRDFQNKFRDCEVLVMINEARQDTQPIEQVFLDINEKSQLLDVEDIFKGHCFEKFTPNLHQELKNMWAQLKHYGKAFKKFYYSDLSQYIYLYLLAQHDKTLPEDLSPNGIHYLTNKTIDEIETLLTGMISYGERIMVFRESIRQIDYRFTDICRDSNEHRNTPDHIMLKSMSMEILECSKALYQKLPFFCLIHMLSVNDYGQKLSHDTLRRIITNLYIYAVLFVAQGKRKSKSDIDHTIRTALIDPIEPIKKTVSASKALRTTAVEEFSIKANFKQDVLESLYSIMDCYVSNDNWLLQKYSDDTGFTPEHFVIPDNRGKKVRWVTDAPFDFNLTNQKAQEYKRRTINFLILPRELNEQIERDDAVSKIQAIRAWYDQPQVNIPVHIEVFLKHTEDLPTYQELVTCKEHQVSREDVESGYWAFVEEYFSEEKQNMLHMKIRDAFRETFRNGI